MNTKSIFLLCMWLFAACFLQAQDKMPQAISYQAVARDAQGRVIAEKTIGIQVEILKGSCSSVDWGVDTYFLQLSMDLNGGSNYEKVSAIQMLPVPYALYAAKAGVAENGGSGNTDNMNTIKFTFVVNDDNVEEDLYPLFSGELMKNSNDILLRFTLLYLDGVDQELTVSIDGLSPQENEIGKSSCVGRMFYLTYENVSDGNYTLAVRDKKNNVVKEYPFTFKTLNK